MSHKSLLATIQEKIGDKIENVDEASSTRVYLDVAPENAVAVNRFLFEDQKGRFAIASGVDTRDAIEVLYHFCFDALHSVVTVRVPVPKATLEVESFAPFCPGASFIEREIHDLLGVTFKNHPNLERLLLEDDWPEGVYPLRKDFNPDDAK